VEVALGDPQVDAPRAGAGPKNTVSEDSPHVEEGNGHAVVTGRNGALLLVEWKPERGLYRISGVAESEPAHPWWHLDSCLFRHFDVEWIRRSPRE